MYLNMDIIETSFFGEVKGLDIYTFFALFIINSIEIILYISKVEFN